MDVRDKSLAQMQARIGKLQDQIRAKDDQIAKQQSKLKKQTTEVARLNQRLSTARDHINRLEGRSGPKLCLQR